MGEVYRARDSRLDREVAVKILNEESSASSERRGRFEREARAVAALNHPSILSVFDFGSSGGLYYIVSELVEGESLRRRMERGAIGVKELYRLAVQIADGMAAAHAAGITHRDLKPENVMLTADGRAKILDFGLARQAGKQAITDSDATRTQLDTEPGRVMGTAGYMSPEQVRGLAVDHRSDQFSFGILLYEMASGGPPFAGDSSVETMNAVLKDEPKPLDPKVPAPLRWTITRCLEKEPAARYESTGDLYRELRGQQEHLSDLYTSTEAAPIPVSARRTFRSWRWVALTVAAAVLGTAGGAWWAGRSRGEIGRLRFTPMEVTWPNAGGARWSPDGKAFVYRADVEGVRQIFLRYMASPSPQQITHGAVNSCVVGWSADGKRVLFTACNPGREMEVSAVPIFGGEPEKIASTPVPINAEVSNGNIAILTNESGKLTVEFGPLGSPLRRYAPAPFETTYNLNGPTLGFSPDGKNILLFLDIPQARTAWILPLPEGRAAPKRVFQDLPAYGGTPEFSWLPDNRRIVLALQDRHDDEHSHLWIADVSSGARRQITAGTSSEIAPAVSPDGKRILFTQFKMESRLVSASLENGAVEPLLSSDLSAGMPAWAMRQERFAYTTNRNGPAEIWMRGGGQDRQLVTQAMFPPESTYAFMVPSLSPEADRLIYTRIDSHLGVSAWISSVSGGPPVRLTNEPAMVEFGGSWSPDGRNYAYLRCASGNCGIAVVKPSGEAAPVLIRQRVAYGLPQWSPDGKWIKVLDPSDGWTLMSPDGKTAETLGLKDAVDLTFSRDSRTVFGIRRDRQRAQMFSFDLQSKAVKPIGPIDLEYFPSSPVGPGIRLSLAPDGKSILYPVARSSSSVWMLEGFE